MKYTVKYSDFPSAVRPVAHNEELPVPNPPDNLTFSSDNSDSDDDHGQQEGDNADCYPTYEASCSSFKLPVLTQGDLNNLVHDLNLSIKQAEVSGFCRKGWNLLHQDTEICFFHNRQNEFKEFFSQENGLVFCYDVCFVVEAVGHQHNPTEWCLFIDSLNVS